ncbi:MAG: PEGA domain-containing protein, partial [Methanogenium sp.]|nr:PEGA domain-containing protein [Methanogenium sp.]
EQAWNARFFMEFYSLKFSSNITPDANFTANPLSGPAPLEVQFNDTSSGTPTAWAWDFNNDGIIDSTEQNPGYTYTEPGLYTVSLTAGNACGENSTTKNDYTNVTVPSIEIHSPIDDRVASGDITVAGNVYDSAITGLTLIHNGVQSTIPVQNGNFSAVVTLTAANNITISGIDSQGNPLSTTLLLDGDMLPAAFEEEIGFDPLNSDSNCTQTAEDESGNGVIDGYEIFDGKLPVFAKYRIGADPFTADTDGNGLTDYFELVKLGVIPGESSQPPLAWIMSDSGDGPASVSSGTGDDPDEDGLSNLEEQTYGTDPLSADTDRDNLQDAYEIQIGTDPLKADSDDDGLTDECELKLGTDPLNADSNGNGIPDGNEDYLSQDSFIDDTLELAVLGQGYAIGNVSVAEVNFTHLISDEVLVSKVYDIGFGPNVRSGELKIKYDSTSVSSGDNLSIYRFDTEIGTFMPVQSVVDASNEIVSCNATNSSKYAVLNSVKWDALFEDPLVETDTVQAAGLAEPADTLSEEEYLDEEHYIKAVDERYPLKTALEVELVEGVDYGVIPYNETPEWNESEIRLETEEPENADLGGYEDPMATSSDEVRYQAVSNGDFFNGMADWSPGSRVYHEGAGSGHEIDTYNLDYSSAPRCLRISLWNNGHTKSHHNYEVAHANVDLTGVDTLTFKYNCLFFQKGTGLTTSRLEFKIDGTRMFRFPEYQHIPYAYETNGWLSQSIDVGGYTGMHNISFNGYLTYGYGTSSSNELSKVQFLIDDVSAWSIQQPAEPDTANIRFFVRDSQTNEGVGSASVSCNNEQKRTDSSGYTNDFFLKSKGTYEYRVEASGYKTHEGLIKVTTLGESKTVYAIINKESAPTGNIRVTSDPNPASIYVDGVFGGSTNDWVYDLLAGSHTVEVRKEGYYPASRTVQVSDGGTTNVAFQLTSEAGTVEVTSSPPGATVYIDDLNKGTTSESSGTLTISEVPVGERQVRVIKEGYVPYLAIVTVEKDQTVYVDAALNNDDLEEDGLLDYYEVNGFRDGFGNHHTTDPDLVDTDGDGLSDGYEAGEMVTENGKTFFRQRSDPTKADTDGDGLDDYLEDAIESDPFNADTDGDGLSDSMEWNTVGTDLWSADS